MMKLELFHRQDCPYSAKVRECIAGRGLESEIEYRDVDAEPEAMEQLIQLTGDEQVPCLVVDGKPMLESDAIVAFLESYRPSVAA
jgi:glutathione S-transferase